MVPRVRTFLLILCLLVTGASAAMPSESSPRPYLALGDSVVFGFITQAGFEYGTPDNFIGYPDYAGRALRSLRPGRSLRTSGALRALRPYRAGRQ